MILQVPPDAPPIVHLAAAMLLFLHIGGASLGMVAGVVAIIARKGQRLHRLAGHVFFASMLTMTAIAAAVSPFLPTAKWTNTTAGVLTFYLVATAWMTVRRRPGKVGRFEVGALAVSASIAAMGLGLVWFGLSTGKAPSFITVYIFCAVAALAAAGDLRLIRSGGFVGAQRIARHLWRMTLALAVALGSFFVGQQDVLPKAVQGSPFLFAPLVITLGLMVFWLIRIRRRPGTFAAQGAPA